MKTALKIMSYLGLILTLLPAFLHFAGAIDFETHKWITLVGTVIYLSTAPFWMNKEKRKTEKV